MGLSVWSGLASSQYNVLRAVRTLVYYIGQLKASRVSIPEEEAAVTLLFGT